MSFFSSESIKPIISSLKHLIDSKADTPNWNETNPSSSSYIKNRPFYEDTKTKHVKCIDNHEFTISADAEPVAMLPTFSISLGSVYTIVFDGVEYECIAYLPSEMGDMPAGYGLIGSTSVFSEDLPFTGGNDEPFLIVSESGMVGIVTSVGNHTISVSGEITTTTLKKIDKKFLPDSTDVVLDFETDILNSNSTYRRSLFAKLSSAIVNGANVFIHDTNAGNGGLYTIDNMSIDSDNMEIKMVYRDLKDEYQLSLWNNGRWNYEPYHLAKPIDKTSTMTRPVGMYADGKLYSEEIISDQFVKTLSNTAILEEAIFATDFAGYQYEFVYNDLLDQHIAIPYNSLQGGVMTSENGLEFAHNESDSFYIDGSKYCAAAYGNGVIAALTYGSRAGYYSLDNGLTWHQANNAPAFYNAKMIYANGVFVAAPIGRNTTVIASSNDGMTWQLHDLRSTYYIRDITFSHRDDKWIAISDQAVLVFKSLDDLSTTQIAITKPSAGGNVNWQSILVDEDAEDPNKTLYFFDGLLGTYATGKSSLIGDYSPEYPSFVYNDNIPSATMSIVRYSGILNDTIFVIMGGTIDYESVVFTKKREDERWERTVLFDNKYLIQKVIVGKDRAIALLIDRNDSTKVKTAVTFDGKTWSNKIETGNFVTPDGKAVDFIDESALTTMLEEVLV